MDKTASYTLTEEQPTYFITHFLFFTAAACFGLSLFLPVFFLPTQAIEGYWVLFLGWLGFVFFQFAWYAAPLMVWAVHLSSRSSRSSFLLAILAIAVASQALLFDEIPIKEARQQILGYGTGFYLWYSSFYIAALGLLYKLVMSHGSCVNDVNQHMFDDKSNDRQDKKWLCDELFMPEQPKTGVKKNIVETMTVNTPPPLPRQF